jgi:signal transduction histidine kinase
MVVREALHNTAHHAEANRARVQLTYAPNALLVSLEDDGRGFLPNSLPEHENHFGIVGMRERVSRLGGTFHLHSAPAQGTVIRIQLPQAALAASEAIGV